MKPKPPSEESLTTAVRPALCLKIEPEVAAEMSQHLAVISDAARKILSGGLNRRALIVLLHDYTGVGKREIDDVLKGLEALRRFYTL